MLNQKAMRFVAASAASVKARLDDDPVPSPCMSVCQMDADTGLCEGCFRTLGEIAQWGHGDAAYRRAVWAEIERRIEQHKK